MKTKAAVLRNVGGPLYIEELELPEVLKSGQVLVKVLCAGICQTQLNEMRGYYATEYIPHLMGHEASAEVVNVADDVKKVKAGDYIAVTWIKGDGLSFHNVTYRRNEEKINAGACAIFSEFAIVAENRVVKIPSMSAKPASLLGCAVSTGMGMVDGLGDIKGKKVAVFGVGGVGAAALMRAKSLGAICTAVDIRDWKLRYAREVLKVDNTANPYRDNLEDFDVAIESSGSKVAMDRAFESINYNGVAIIAGNIIPGQKVYVDPYDLMKGKTIRGSWGGGVHPDKAIPFYADLHLKGEIDINKLISRDYDFTFKDLDRAFKDLIDGELIRSVIKFKS